MNKHLIYESLTDYVKPKSEEEIRKSLGFLKDLTLKQKLSYACQYGLDWLAKEAIDEGADLAFNDNAPIQDATYYGHANVVKLLLQYPNVDPSDSENLAIGWASEQGHIDIVKLLLADTRVDPSDDHNCAFKNALEYNHLEICKLLLLDKRVRKTLSQYIIQKYKYKLKQNELLKESLSDYVKPKSEEDIKKVSKKISPYDKIYYGCKYGILWLVEKGLDEGVDPSVDDNQAIIIASIYGYIDIVKLLLKDPRVNPADQRNDAIRSAAYYGHIDTFKLLLKDPRVDPSDSNNDAIRGASFYRNGVIVKLLLKDPRVYNSLSQEKLMYYESRIQESLSDYVKPKSEEEIRKNLSLEKLSSFAKFNIACENDLIWLLKEILDEDPAFKNKIALNPQFIIHKIVIYDKDILFRYLISKIKFTPDILNQPQHRANVLDEFLRRAAEFGAFNIAKFLLTIPEVNPATNDNYPLRYAAYNGRVELLKLFMEDGDPRIDPSDRDNDAIKTAYSNNDYNIVNILLKDKRVVDKLSPELYSLLKEKIKYNNLLLPETDYYVDESFNF